MIYIYPHVEKITTVLGNNGCGLYPPDVNVIEKIVAEAIIASTLDSSLVEDAVKYFEDN